MINGGITDLDQASALLAEDATGPAPDGVMLGHAAYETPRVLTGVDRMIFGKDVADPDPYAIVDRLEPIIARHIAGDGRLANVTRHILGLFNGYPGARAWRRILTVEASVPGAGVEVLRRALAEVKAPRPASTGVEPAGELALHQ